MRQETATRKLDDQQVWDVVAWVWQQNAPPPGTETAQALYARDCAACHGESGAGDGVFAKVGATPRPAEHGEHTQMEMSTAPAAFSDPVAMLGASPALLHGKIVRGGMGTGMPYWGPVYTDDQIWALVHYLYSFQFSDEVNE